MTLFDRLVQAASLEAPPGLLAGDGNNGEVADKTTDAAVLIALTDRTQPGVILTVRRADLRRHGGQIAFPGGRVDAGEDVQTAAVREAEEEIGLPRASVRIAGSVDPYRTLTGFNVTPVVGVIPPDLPLTPQEQEVAEIFETPLAHLLDPRHHLRRSVLFEGAERHYYEIMWEGRRIWGATAAMIVNLSKRLLWN